MGSLKFNKFLILYYAGRIFLVYNIEGSWQKRVFCLNLIAETSIAIFVLKKAALYLQNYDFVYLSNRLTKGRSLPFREMIWIKILILWTNYEILFVTINLSLRLWKPQQIKVSMKRQNYQINKNIKEVKSSLKNEKVKVTKIWENKSHFF